MWIYEHDSNVHWDGEDELYWEYFTINDENGEEIARCDEEKDARLIAAAPELLEALQQTIPHIREQSKRDGPAFGPLQLINRVIAKALGETK